jgi:hypothetical protein
MKGILIVLLLVAGFGGQRCAQAQVPGEVAVGGDECEVAYTVGFGLSDTVPDLTAQSELSEAAQWVAGEPGRYLRVLRDQGRTADQGRLSAVRVSAALQYLQGSGINPAVLTVGDISEVPPNQREAMVGRSTVVIMTCWGLPNMH